MPNPNIHTIPAESTAFITFENNEGISLMSHGQKNYLVLDDYVDYPTPERGRALNELLLEEDEGEHRLLVLPDNFATMPQVLNDAIGDNTSDRAKELTIELFRELGMSLAEVAANDRMAPESLSYRNIILSREDPGPKLLPPISFIEFSKYDDDQVKVHVIESLRKSLYRGAANSTQKRNVTAVFSGFIKGFDW